MDELRLAVACGKSLRQREARALAELLARLGYPVRLVAPREAEVVLAWGEADVPGEKPFVRLPRRNYQPRKDGFRRDLENLLKKDKLPPVRNSTLKADLPGLFQAVLAGWEEKRGPRDSHGRPTPESTAAGRLGCLDRPFLDEWARALGGKLARQAGRGQPPESPAWVFATTFDIDSAGMFRGRAALRNLRTIARQKPDRLLEALGLAFRSWIGAARDPHLRIREIAEMLEGLQVPATFFCQTHRRHRLDSYDLSRCRALGKNLRAILRNRYHEVGLHSSYATSDARPRFFHLQWRRLRREAGRGISPVHRAHYLRSGPRLAYWSPFNRESFVDSSLGFGAHEGFRRGTCLPFRASDEIIEAPPTVMDTTLRYFRGMGPEEAYQRGVELMDRVSAVGGLFVPVLHPNNMEPILWPGWQDVLLDWITEAKRRGARFQSLASCALALQERADQIERELVSGQS